MTVEVQHDDPRAHDAFVEARQVSGAKSGGRDEVRDPQFGEITDIATCVKHREHEVIVATGPELRPLAIEGTANRIARDRLGVSEGGGASHDQARANGRDFRPRCRRSTGGDARCRPQIPQREQTVKFPRPFRGASFPSWDDRPTRRGEAWISFEQMVCVAEIGRNENIVVVDKDQDPAPRLTNSAQSCRG